MTPKVFFTFDYERDYTRALVVNSVWEKEGGQSSGLWPSSLWRQATQDGESAIKGLIDEAIKFSDLTVVLIGNETSQLSYVKYAVQESHDQGKHLMGIYIHRIPNETGNIDRIGNAHFGELGKGENRIFFWQKYSIYRWMIDDGARHLSMWMKRAAMPNP